MEDPRAKVDRCSFIFRREQRQSAVHWPFLVDTDLVKNSDFTKLVR